MIVDEIYCPNCEKFNNFVDISECKCGFISVMRFNSVNKALILFSIGKYTINAMIGKNIDWLYLLDKHGNILNKIDESKLLSFKDVLQEVETIAILQ